jgi:protein TonB
MPTRRFLALLMFLCLAGLALAQTDQTKPARPHISSTDALKLKVHDANPVYPVEARKQHIQGDVFLQFIIDKEGKVVNLRAVQGDPVLAEAALDAAKQWRFRPYLIKGDPVEVETTIKIQFHM